MYDNAGMAIQEAFHEVFSGFELYLNDGNTTSLLSFDFTGQLDSTQILSEDERFTREISSGLISMAMASGHQPEHRSPPRTPARYPKTPHPMGRSRFAYQGNDGIVLTRHRLDSDDDAGQWQNWV